jgi:hypothetical protein
MACTHRENVDVRMPTEVFTITVDAGEIVDQGAAFENDRDVLWARVTCRDCGWTHKYRNRYRAPAWVRRIIEEATGI